jgi:hypothetical protein
MQLNLSKPTEIMKAFFENNGYLKPEGHVQEDRELSVAICKDGMAFGEFYENPDWLVHKTFVSKNLLFEEQLDIEKNLINDLRLEFEELKVTSGDDKVKDMRITKELLISLGATG